MGRAGSGGGGGHRSHSGGHSSGSRSSGGHRPSPGGSSSRRAGFGSSHSYGGSSRPSGPSYGGYGYGGGYRGGYIGPPPMGGPPPRRSGRGCLATVTSVIAAVAILIAMVSILSPTVGLFAVSPSTTNRERLDTGIAFDNDCVIDELGWVDNIGKTAKGLREFYEKTGVQPFVYLRAYDPALLSDDAKASFARDWYEENMDSESAFLFVYFAEEDADNDVGYMAYVNGLQTSAVMDAEAVDIFWDYIDMNWYSSKSTDAALVDTFSSTAKRIMSRSTTGLDVAKIAFMGLFVVVAGLVVLRIMNTRRRHEAERNEEVVQILNADIDGHRDDTLDKYE